MDETLSREILPSSLLNHVHLSLFIGQLFRTRRSSQTFAFCYTANLLADCEFLKGLIQCARVTPFLAAYSVICILSESMF